MDAARSFDEALERLEEALAWARRIESPLGYFPAVLRAALRKVRGGGGSGIFDDPARAEALSASAAGRYLRALADHRAGRLPPRAWRIAFGAAGGRRLLALQHLLLGVNAHLNLDLGVAAARAAPGEALPALHDDFDRLFALLAGRVAAAHDALAPRWPGLGQLGWTGEGADEPSGGFSLRRARGEAWRLAVRLAPLTPWQQAAVVDEADERAAAIARRILRPGPLHGAAARLLRLLERRGPGETIDLLRKMGVRGKEK